MEPSDLIFAVGTFDGEKCFIIVPRAHFRETESLYDDLLGDEVPELGAIVEEADNSIFLPQGDSFEVARLKLLSLGLKEDRDLRDFVQDEGMGDADDDDDTFEDLCEEDNEDLEDDDLCEEDEEEEEDDDLEDG